MAEEVEEVEEDLAVVKVVPEAQSLLEFFQGKLQFIMCLTYTPITGNT